jgi:hypothetical protein
MFGKDPCHLQPNQTANFSSFVKLIDSLSLCLVFLSHTNKHSATNKTKQNKTKQNKIKLTMVYFNLDLVHHALKVDLKTIKHI